MESEQRELMKPPHTAVTKDDLIDILYRIARNERLAVTKRVESIEIICRLKKYSGFPAKPGKPANVPPQVVVAAPVQVVPEPSADLLGLTNVERHKGPESTT